MNALLDTNVVLDLLLEREPWFAEFESLWLALERGQIIGHVAATSVTNVFYIIRRLNGLPNAHAPVRRLLGTAQIAPVGRAELEHAARLPGNDFEDNLQIACAVASAVDAIVTRDPAGFRGATLAGLLAR